MAHDTLKNANKAKKDEFYTQLTDSVYSGSWVTDAKRYFSKNSRPKIGDEYLGGSANRQEYFDELWCR